MLPTRLLAVFTLLMYTTCVLAVPLVRDVEEASALDAEGNGNDQDSIIITYNPEEYIRDDSSQGEDANAATVYTDENGNTYEYSAEEGGDDRAGIYGNDSMMCAKHRIEHCYKLEVVE